MNVYKKGSCLFFELDDGKTVKYDFATGMAFGKSGNEVKDLRNQLKGITVNDVLACCNDVQYAKFLHLVARREETYPGAITIFGTMLSRVSYFSNYEQFFYAKIDDIVQNNLRYSIGDIPKGLISLAKKNNFKISNKTIEQYKKNPNLFNVVFDLEYNSLTEKDVFRILDLDGYSRDRGHYSIVFELIEKYGYTAKSLFLYLDKIVTFEAVEDKQYLLRELEDYCRMMSSISRKFDKYPRHFLTTIRIATRNYNRLKKEFEEGLFKQRIKPDMEHSFDSYIFIYPKTIQDIKDEAVSQNNCVASYIDDVIDGSCDILFLRKKDSPNESLVTIEVQNGKIVQAKRRFNYPISKDEQSVVDKWNKWYSKNGMSKAV